MARVNDLFGCARYALDCQPNRYAAQLSCIRPALRRISNPFSSNQQGGRGGWNLRGSGREAGYRGSSVESKWKVSLVTNYF